MPDEGRPSLAGAWPASAAEEEADLRDRILGHLRKALSLESSATFAGIWGNQAREEALERDAAWERERAALLATHLPPATREATLWDLRNRAARA